MAGELPSFTGGLPGAGRLGRTLDRALPPRAAAAIALNERMAAALRDAGLPPERVFTVPPPVDTRPFGPPPERHGLAPVAYTGNLDAYQNIGLLERAVERARESEPALAFLVATGDKATPRGAERVASAGFADVCALLRRDVVLACPRTAWPGYPIKLANGLAAGSAIVACEGAAHGLEHGRTALVVPDDDAAAFAGALLRAARDPALRGRLGRAARAHAEEHLAPARVAAQVTGAYAAACG
jgi:glycosyltransferase involved in cell wall biosynthesis